MGKSVAAAACTSNESKLDYCHRYRGGDTKASTAESNWATSARTRKSRIGAAWHHR